jgi:hypothetical protein
MPTYYDLYSANRHVEDRIEDFLIRATLTGVVLWHLYRDRKHS